MKPYLSPSAKLLVPLLIFPIVLAACGGDDSNPNPPPAPPVSAANSTITAAPTTVTADGTAAAAITVTLKDTDGNPYTGSADVTIKADPCTHCTLDYTNENGEVTGTLSSTVVEDITLSLTVNGTTSPSTAIVHFVPPPADAIYYDANVVTMNDAQPGAQAVAVRGTEIVAVGSNSEVMTYQGANTKTTDLEGATILPGFLDPHSHLLAYALYSDANWWTDVSGINIYFKPPPGDSRCPDPTDYQHCFIPVETQDDAINRITEAVAAASAGTSSGARRAVYAANYDPARLGHGPSCPDPISKVGFQCTNLENGAARHQLDAISSDIPIFVASQAGHVTFVNTPALRELNICGTDVAVPADCHAPITNPTQEMALAQVGQLDEDLALYSIGYFAGKIFKADPESVPAGIARAVSLYAQHGYTLAQEGAADLSQVLLYLDAIQADPEFPLTIALWMYDANSGDYADTVALAAEARQLINGNPDIFVAALKSFADGSPQEYTADMAEPYLHIFPPFTWSIFPQPYTGLPDLSEDEMAARAVIAHQAGYPLAIHQNGDQSIGNSIDAFRKAQQLFPAPDFRDVVLHAPFIDADELAVVKKLNDPVSFLMDDLYYWGLPLCQQIMGSTLTTEKYSLYPAADAVNAGLHVTLHSDTPVSPPDPLFEIWIAKTRAVQQPPWYPNLDPQQCPAFMSPHESISIKQGIRAFTTEAAWQYGLEDELGMIKPGFTADLVILSTDPLSMEGHPDDLKNVRVLGTVHRGYYTANPDADEPPIWPE